MSTTTAPAAGTAPNDAGTSGTTTTTLTAPAAAPTEAAGSKPTDPPAPAAGSPAAQAPAEGGKEGQQEGKQDGKGDEPAEYDFQVPEGVTLDEADTEAFKTIARDLKLPADAAQKVVNLAVQREQARAEAYAKQIGDWADEVRADKVLGVAENQAIARKAIETFGSPELRSLLNSTGLGNHPEMVRLAYAIGKATSEDSVVSNPGRAAAPRLSTAQVFYPNQS